MLPLNLAAQRGPGKATAAHASAMLLKAVVLAYS